ncbi:hypothetical protein [Tanticharoenia sakaeratensis]|uniref:Class I SAM-dependent methyltransferase n=1 Tax=Tanticharoenia sakaeratensis NBRC 103193 TaxID=1231623 RepID=A0A0D6MMZ1_9PROT|nr:hypothetical protein [Tanticharoenia sakaeratensis]GAN54801.1 hypothetical protein Tasa_031_019 [Tanticharoenia sakaeratensis NBRC 103193]GBQ21518.1 hypothetical protein AA103193_1754 [Tanticharoenia sakaeratensis NBRC 103193]
MSLFDSFVNTTSGKIEKNAHFFALYDRYLARYRNHPCVLYIVIDSAHAEAQAEMWARYLGAFAQIVCLTEHDFDRPQIHGRRSDLTDPSFRMRLLEEFGPADIVIDDGTHLPDITISTFEILMDLMTNTGLYFIEDTYTAYWSSYQGEVGRDSTVIGYTKALIDELHASYTSHAIPPNAFSARVCGIHIYDGLIIYEFGRNTNHRSMTNLATS